MRTPDSDHAFVAHSEIRSTATGAEDLIASFRRRLGKVDDWPGFGGLEVWQDQADPSRFVMVSWWTDRDSFLRYMRSEDHRDSHDRIPGGADRPRPAGFTRFRVVAR